MKVLYVIARSMRTVYDRAVYIAAATTYDGAKSIIKDRGINESVYKIMPINVPFYGKYLRYAYIYWGYRTIDGCVDGNTIAVNIPVYSVSELVHIMTEVENTSVWQIVSKKVKDEPGKHLVRSGKIMPANGYPPFHMSEGKIVAGVDKIRIYRI